MCSFLWNVYFCIHRAGNTTVVGNNHRTKWPKILNINTKNKKGNNEISTSSLQSLISQMTLCCLWLTPFLKQFLTSIYFSYKQHFALEIVSGMDRNYSVWLYLLYIIQWYIESCKMLFIWKKIDVQKKKKRGGEGAT